MFGQLFSTDIKISFFVILILLLVLYVLSIIWVVRDAYSRGAKYKFWGLIAIIPIFGLIAYMLLRPQLLLIDRDEQELEIAVKQRELLKYGECSKCGQPVLNDYLVCPKCQQRLKVACTKCGRALDFKWKACPWCGTPKAGMFGDDFAFDVSKVQNTHVTQNTGNNSTVVNEDNTNKVTDPFAPQTTAPVNNQNSVKAETVK